METRDIAREQQRQHAGVDHEAERADDREAKEAQAHRISSAAP
jgi:hypothetical protein